MTAISGRAAKLLALAVLIACATAAQAPTTLPLPTLGQCKANAHPRLPEKWRAIYLLAPFTNAQLVLGELVYDGSLPAMRVTLHGVRRGSLDLFFQGSVTYALHSEGQTIIGCQSLGDTGWRPLPADWLTANSRCAGSAPIAETTVDWWKTPLAPQPASYWIWYRTSDQTPFRLVFPSPNDRLAPLSQYALSHQINFERLSRVDFAEVMDVCRSARSAMTEDGGRALRERLEALSHAERRADQEIKRLMPELATCPPALPLPKWPH